mmetsp:Transcript_23607/g.70248  ORF Transcript_23607/g.70248 Transcript_23607/m.70248 type:complete len:406 (+) Transcript_23607:109-1326(+)
MPMPSLSGAEFLQAEAAPSRLHEQGFPLTVKNTFIDFDRSAQDDDFLDESEIKDSFRKRQMSEPTPSLFRQQGLYAGAFSNSFIPEGEADFGRADTGDLGDMVDWENVIPRGLDLDDFELDDEAQDLGWSGGEGLAGMPMADMLASVGMPPAEWSATTTVMMRNLPNKYTQRMLLTEINHTGFLGAFDFLYLPIDPETNANRGYAFLNFIDPSFAWMFKKSYEGRKMSRFNSNKVVSVMPATLQGFAANYAHYASSRVNRGDPSARPLFLREPKDDTPVLHGVPAASNGSRRGGKRRPGREPGCGLQNPVWAQKEAEVAAAQWGSAGMGTYFGLDGGGGLPDLLRDDTAAASLSLPMTACASSHSVVPKFCPHCGGPIQSGFQFCPHCGSGLDFGSKALDGAGAS